MSSYTHLIEGRDDERKLRSRHLTHGPSSPVKGTGDSIAFFRHLQRMAGNAAVNGLLRQYAVREATLVAAASGSDRQMGSGVTGGTLQRTVIQRDDDDGASAGFHVSIPGVGSVAVDVSGSGGDFSASVPGVGSVAVGGTVGDNGVAVAGAGSFGHSSGSFAGTAGDGSASGVAQVTTPQGSGAIGGSVDTGGHLSGSGAVVTPNSSGSFQGSADTGGHIAGSATLNVGSSSAVPGDAAQAGLAASPTEVIATPTLRLGANGPDVAHLQQRLNDAAIAPPLAVDSIFGAKTRHAVMAFQSGHGLAADGTVGPRTWSALLG